jgi:hypothetical protein
VEILPEFATFCRVKFGQDLPIGKRNIFEIFNYIRDHGGPSVVFYDYTKIKRNWAECKRIGIPLIANHSQQLLRTILNKTQCYKV